MKLHFVQYFVLVMAVSLLGASCSKPAAETQPLSRPAEPAAIPDSLKLTTEGNFQNSGAGFPSALPQESSMKYAIDAKPSADKQVMGFSYSVIRVFSKRNAAENIAAYKEFFSKNGWQINTDTTNSGYEIVSMDAAKLPAYKMNMLVYGKSGQPGFSSDFVLTVSCQTVGDCDALGIK